MAWTKNMSINCHQLILDSFCFRFLIDVGMFIYFSWILCAQLIYDTIRAGGSEAAGFGDCLKLFPQHLVASRYVHETWICAKIFLVWSIATKLMDMLDCRSGNWPGWIELSGKMAVLARLLSELRCKTDDRIVLVSNYTQVRAQPLWQQPIWANLNTPTCLIWVVFVERNSTCPFFVMYSLFSVYRPWIYSLKFAERGTTRSLGLTELLPLVNGRSWFWGSMTRIR
jgi:hypothetical protein